MRQTALGKSLFLLIISVSLALLLVACQQGALPTPQSEPATVTTVDETLVAPTQEIQPTAVTPENTPVPTPLPTIMATPTATALPTSTPAPSATPAPTMTATRTSFSGRLVFSSRRQDTNEDGVIDEQDGINLYSLNVDTQQMTQLTSGAQRDIEADWSPDGSQIAFVSNREGNFELYVMNADGSELRRLTNTPEDETRPVWSPDGTKIVYVQVTFLESGLLETRLYLISPTGNDSQPLTDGPSNDDFPDWSPDGRYLTFTRTEEVTQADGSTYRDKYVYLLDMQEDRLFRLTPSYRESGTGFDDPQWLPRDGYYLSMFHDQSQGDSPSLTIKVYDLEWEEGQPALYRVFTIADAAGRHVWGSNGEWLISIVINGYVPGTLLSDEAFHDLVLLPVDFATQERAQTPDPAVRTSVNYSPHDGELITNDTFYDSYPDWTP